ncbi:MAG: hypothetical protein M3O31_00820, partial [Acidobacteriota bacterium]|nr:hypothetical protein [Acidobacteriota bacterium]
MGRKSNWNTVSLICLILGILTFAPVRARAWTASARPRTSAYKTVAHQAGAAKTPTARTKSLVRTSGKTTSGKTLTRKS